MAGNDAAYPRQLNKVRNRRRGTGTEGDLVVEGGRGRRGYEENKRRAEGEHGARASRWRKVEKVWHMIPAARREFVPCRGKIFRG